VPYYALYSSLFTFLAAFLLFSALDDLVPLLICLTRRRSGKKRGRTAATGQPAFALETPLEKDNAERRFAIFVPCWKESRVIRNMVQHNLASIRYRHFDFFLGAYPNDEETTKAVEDLACTCRSVHVALVPHDGPTSKADCLNWVFQSLLRFEEAHAAHFDAVVVHDAEDLIHPDSLSLINQKLNQYDTVQVPVLPLATRFGEWTHGIYCDEFAEFQTIDMPARGLSGSFLPSNGVGTGYSRAVLERLAEERSNRVFEPASLTEDYESGVRIFRLGFRQFFATLERHNDAFLATREYFPRTFQSAVRQRTRWVTGICLQGWERLGWRESGITRYWFWRDRKALITNPIGLLVSVFMLLSLADLAVAYLTGMPWHFGIPWNLTQRLCWANLALQAIRTAVRMACAGRVYGWKLATGVPFRAFYESIINGIATLRAIRIYAAARVRRRPLVWLKTEHSYPNRAALEPSWKGMGEVLVGSGYIAPETLAMAQRLKGPDTDLGHFLLANGLLSEEDYCEVASLCSGLSSRPSYIDPVLVDQRAVRCLPMRVQSKCRVTPIQIQGGQLYLATPQAPATRLLDEIQKHTRLQVNFRIVTPSNYAELRSVLFGETPAELALRAPVRALEQRAFAAAG
jgi:bacteriophage N4 adsorption protein B